MFFLFFSFLFNLRILCFVSLSFYQPPPLGIFFTSTCLICWYWNEKNKYNKILFFSLPFERFNLLLVKRIEILLYLLICFITKILRVFCKKNCSYWIIYITQYIRKGEYIKCLNRRVKSFSTIIFFCLSVCMDSDIQI